jgi:hypothetical protein
VVRGVAARVTSATGDAGVFAICGSAYQPSDRQAHFVRVRLPRMSDTLYTTDNRSLNLRKRPTLHLDRQLSRSRDHRLDRAAASTQSSRLRQ